MKYTHPSEEKNLDARTLAFQNFSTQLPEERLNVGPANIGRNGSGKYQFRRTLMLSFHFMMVAENGIKKRLRYVHFAIRMTLRRRLPPSRQASRRGSAQRRRSHAGAWERSNRSCDFLPLAQLSRAISSAGSVPRTGPAWLRQRRSQHCCSSSGALLRRGFWLQWPWLRRGLWREPPCRQAG